MKVASLGSRGGPVGDLAPLRAFRGGIILGKRGADPSGDDAALRLPGISQALRMKWTDSAAKWRRAPW